MSQNKQLYQTKIWFEEPEDNNPFSAKNSYVHGYNLYEDVLPNSSWSEYIYLLFKSELPSPQQSQLLEKIAISIANPGLRDNSIRAAMNAGVGGSTAASSLISALGVGAGQYAGAQEIYRLVSHWQDAKQNLPAWKDFTQNPNQKFQRVELWDPIEHPPGFEPNASSCCKTVIDALTFLSSISPNGNLRWLEKNRKQLEKYAKYPLSMSGVIATALYDLGFTSKESEMLFLILRLPGAAVHALEQEKFGWKAFPFFGNETILTDDPKNKNLT